MTGSTKSESIKSKIKDDAYKILHVLNTPDPITELGRIQLQVNRAERNKRFGISSQLEDGWQLPIKLWITHSQLKGKLQFIVDIGEVTHSNYCEKLADIENMLTETNKLVDKGKDIFEDFIGATVEYFPKAFYLDFLKSKAPETEIFANAYFILTALEIANFEIAMTSIRDNYIDIEGKTEFYEKYISGTELMTAAQASFELGFTHAHQSMLGEETRKRDSIIEVLMPAIRTRAGLEKSNTERSSGAIKKWAPLVKEVHEKLESLANKDRKIKEACGHVADKHEGINSGTLRNRYNEYLKYPSKYE